MSFSTVIKSFTMKPPFYLLEKGKYNNIIYCMVCQTKLKNKVCYIKVARKVKYLIFEHAHYNIYYLELLSYYKFSFGLSKKLFAKNKV